MTSILCGWCSWPWARSLRWSGVKPMFLLSGSTNPTCQSWIIFFISSCIRSLHKWEISRTGVETAWDFRGKEWTDRADICTKSRRIDVHQVFEGILHRHAGHDIKGLWKSKSIGKCWRANPRFGWYFHGILLIFIINDECLKFVQVPRPSDKVVTWPLGKAFKNWKYKPQAHDNISWLINLYKMI